MDNVYHAVYDNPHILRIPCFYLGTDIDVDINVNLDSRDRPDFLRISSMWWDCVVIQEEIMGQIDD